MQSVNPLKLREYLAAGLPVVSVDLPEVRVFAAHVAFATNAEQFLEMIEQALGQASATQKSQRSESVRRESWAARVIEIEGILDGMGQSNNSNGIIEKPA